MSAVYVAEKRRQALDFLLLTPKWHSARWLSFIVYNCSFRITEEPSNASESDLRTLKNFVDDEVELCHFRCEAALTLAVLYGHDGNGELKDLDLGADYCRQALGFAEQATQEERQKSIPKMAAEGFGESDVGVWTVGEFLDRRKLVLRDIIDKFENPKPQYNEEAVSSNAVMATFLERWSSVGGGFCDCCKKTREQLGVVKLNCCSRCKMAYYCSSECQRKQWRAGHKEACRKEKEIKVGDIMKIRHTSLPEVAPVIVIRAVPGDSSVWEVKTLGTDLRPIDGTCRRMSISELVHIRPAK